MRTLAAARSPLAAAASRWRAAVTLCPVEAIDGPSLQELVHSYADELARNHQPAEAKRVLALLDDWEQMFVKIVAGGSDGTGNGIPAW